MRGSKDKKTDRPDDLSVFFSKIDVCIFDWLPI
jgi:hypothetical protein